MSRLFVLGSANIDLTFRVQRMPVPGVTEVCPYQLGFGGKGANQAVQAARLGADVTFCGKVGDDSFGPAIIEELKKENISTEHVSVAPGMSTGTATILVDPSGQNSIVTHAGPNIAMSGGDVVRASSEIQSANVLLATLETPAEPLLAAFKIAKNAGIRTILNPAPPVDFPHELLHYVDICVPNESELFALTGLRADTVTDVADAAEALRQKGPKSVVVTLAERGAYVLSADQSGMAASFRVGVIDSSGAGDSFTAALAVELAKGESLLNAVAFANRVAALSVTRPGTQTSFPTREEVDAAVWLSW